MSSNLTTDAQERKDTPIYHGFIQYFPKAMAEVARLSLAANEQHNPGTKMHWDRSKSGDELEALTRHLVDAGSLDDDGQRHSAKIAWRAMANLEKELEVAVPDEVPAEGHEPDSVEPNLWIPARGLSSASEEDWHKAARDARRVSVLTAQDNSVWNEGSIERCCGSCPSGRPCDDCPVPIYEYSEVFPLD